MTDRSRTWDVGYIRKDGKGRDVYIIRQSIGGKQYEVSTRAFSATAAHDQLKRFQADPEGYDPRGDVQPDPVYLDEDLVEKFIHYSREEKENTAKWVREQRK